MSLIATDVCFAYKLVGAPQELAVKQLSLSLHPGEVTLLMGQTGSGKSTFLRLLAGLLKPDTGTVLLNGVAPKPGDVGLVFQQPETQLFAETVRDDVAFGPLNIGMSNQEAKQVADRALNDVGLDPETFGDRSPFALSGGEARKAAIAGVLAMQPKVLLLDEPTAGLDRLGRESVQDLVEKLKTDDVSVIVVSHTAEEFLGRSDNTMLLSQGCCSYAGSSMQLTQDPSPFITAGISPPHLLQLQMSARDSGLGVPEFSLDPATVSQTLLSTAGWRS